MSADTEAPPWQDAATLRRLYHDEDCTQAEIADRLGTSKQTVSRWMGRHDIETEHGYKRQEYTDAALLDHVRAVAETVDGRPTAAEVRAADGPSPDTMTTRFGSWTATLEEAGIERERSAYRHTLDGDQALILQMNPAVALELQTVDEPFFLADVDVGHGDLQRLHERGVVVHATDAPVLHDGDDATAYAWKWDLADGVREWIAHNVDPPAGCPEPGCHATGVSNLGDGEFTCTAEDCDSRFDRETAREVLEG
jgi:hypothetical protein